MTRKINGTGKKNVGISRDGTTIMEMMIDPRVVNDSYGNNVSQHICSNTYTRKM